MALSERLALLVTADTQGAVREVKKLGDASEKELGKSEKSLDRWGQRLTATGATMVATGAVLGAGLFKAAMGASQLEQAVGATEVVFRDAGGQVEEYADTAAESMGLSRRAYMENANSIGALLNNMGFARDESAEWANQLTQLGADLSAAFGGKPEEAVHALGRALVGEFDPLERFNVSIRQADINLKAVEMGLAASTSAVGKEARAQAALALIMEQTADIQGQYGREAETTAGRMATATAEFQNATDQLGTGLLPMLTKLLEIGSGATNMFNDLSPGVQQATGTVAGLTTGFLVFGGAASLLIGQVIKMRENFKALGSALGPLSGRIQAVTMTAAAAAAVWVTWRIAIEKWEQAGRDAASGALAPLQQEIAAGNLSFDEHREKLNQLIVQYNRLSDTVAGSQAPWDEDFRTQIGSFQGEMAPLIESMRAADDATVALTESTGLSANAAFEWVSAQQALGMDISNTDLVLQSYNEEVRENNGLNHDAALEIEQLKEAYEEWEAVLRRQFDPMFGLLDAQQKNVEATLAVADAQVALNEARATGDPAAVAEAERGLDEAHRNAARSALDMTIAQQGLLAAVEAGEVSFTDAKTQLDNWVASGAISQETADVLKTKMDLLSLGVQSIPQAWHTVVTADVSQAVSAIDSVLGRLAQFAGFAGTIAGLASQAAAPAPHPFQPGPGGATHPFTPQPGGVPWATGQSQSPDIYLDGELVSRPLGRRFNTASRSTYGRRDR